ncbi:hypothetical protein QBC36DRAFT_83418 [Triangularia setosa]|uniref:Uncharacterized protein n=1 Tax=Triangularia setosa TaxID=2587417 RepID=A0AAN6WHB9_9PEZI|nr:hypothetical protein QBC36DRAFT_83418 [Podospora setosa]
MSSSSRYPSTTSTNPSKYAFSSTTTSNLSSSRPGTQSSPWKPPSQPSLRPTYPTSHPPTDDFSLAMPGIDPLSFFLTPHTPYPEDDDTAMLDFDYFDYNAGIDDGSKHRPNSPDSIRSVSPSSLAGFSRPEVRPPTLPKSAVSSPSLSTPDLEFDYGSSLGGTPESDGMEEYYRHRFVSGYGLEGGYGGVPLLLKDFTAKGKDHVKFSKREKGGRGQHYGHHHVWREPSPDVYSIEEENGKGGKAKRVRFVLPGEEGVY